MKEIIPNAYRVPAKSTPRPVALRWRLEGEPFPAGVQNMLPGRHGPHWHVIGTFRWRWLALLVGHIYVGLHEWGAVAIIAEEKV